MIFSFIWFGLKIIFLYFVVNISKVIYKKFIRKPLDLLKRYGENSYVLVTGATDGIGKEFCFQFAKLGFNIILVSRNLEKLSKVSEEIRDKYPKTQTKIIEIDFKKKTQKEDYINLFQENDEIKDLDISILINNIGISSRQLFSSYTLDEINDSINVNIIPQAYLSHIFLNKFIKRQKTCAIISMSSYSGTMPLYNSSMYCATKIFDDYLIRTIDYENKGGNIDCLSVRPLYVDTPSRAGHKKEFAPITSEECVSGVLQDLGQDSVTNGHWKHCIMAVFFDLVPISLKNTFRKLFKKKNEIELKKNN